ncbi:MAG: glycoside hydrolase, partial [Muribaculaceae bacterium]|nr:glycoside hydrolase [Muribaculaceae bacterium]
CEGRVNGPEDEGDIDIVLRRSVDRGQTWSPLITVKNDGENRSRNPCPIYLPEQNRVVLVSCWNPGATGVNHVFVTYSDDEGLTWAPEKEITADVTPADYKWYATGPCHGMVKQFEPHKGRIVVSCNHNTTKQSKGCSHVIYSDDNGATWHLGGIVDLYDTNESTVTELSNGDLMLNMRPAGSNPKYRIKSISKDGGQTWEPCESTTLMDPMCQGSIFYYGKNADGKGMILFTNSDSQSSRFHNTLKLSEDDGLTWSRKYDYTQTDYGGYSDVACYTDGTIAVLYEFGYKNSGIAFQNIDLSQLK